MEAAEVLPFSPTPGLAHPRRPWGSWGVPGCQLPAWGWYRDLAPPPGFLGHGAWNGGGARLWEGRQAPGGGHWTQVCGLDGLPSHPSLGPSAAQTQAWGLTLPSTPLPRPRPHCPHCIPQNPEDITPIGTGNHRNLPTPCCPLPPGPPVPPHPSSQTANAPTPGGLGWAQRGEGQDPQVRRWGQCAE